MTPSTKTGSSSPASFKFFLSWHGVTAALTRCEPPIPQLHRILALSTSPVHVRQILMLGLRLTCWTSCRHGSPSGRGARPGLPEARAAGMRNRYTRCVSESRRRQLFDEGLIDCDSYRPVKCLGGLTFLILEEAGPHEFMAQSSWGHNRKIKGLRPAPQVPTIRLRTLRTAVSACFSIATSGFFEI